MVNDPAVEDPDEDAVAAVSAIIPQKAIAIAAAFDQDARRIAGVNFAGVFANAVAEDVVLDGIATGIPHLETGVARTAAWTYAFVTLPI